MTVGGKVRLHMHTHVRGREMHAPRTLCYYYHPRIQYTCIPMPYPCHAHAMPDRMLPGVAKDFRTRKTENTPVRTATQRHRQIALCLPSLRHKQHARREGMEAVSERSACAQSIQYHAILGCLHTCMLDREPAGSVCRAYRCLTLRRSVWLMESSGLPLLLIYEDM